MENINPVISHVFLNVPKLFFLLLYYFLPALLHVISYITKTRIIKWRNFLQCCICLLQTPLLLNIDLLNYITVKVVFQTVISNISALMAAIVAAGIWMKILLGITQFNNCHVVFNHICTTFPNISEAALPECTCSQLQAVMTGYYGNCDSWPLSWMSWKFFNKGCKVIQLKYVIDWSGRCCRSSQLWLPLKYMWHLVFSCVSLQDLSTVTPVTLHVDPHGFYLYWTDQNKVEHKYTWTDTYMFILQIHN